MNIYFYILEFILAVVVVFLYYKLIETKKIKRFTKKNTPTDLKLFVHATNVDTNKISNKKLMNVVAIINGIDIGLVLLITNIVDNFFLKLLIAIPSIFIVLLSSYRLAALIIKKKGLAKNES